MIPCSEDKLQSVSWQFELKDMITSIDELICLLPGFPGAQKLLHAVAKGFPLRIPRSYLHKILALPNPEPLLAQFVPNVQEMLSVQGFVRDPLEEQRVNHLPGLLQKYQGRVLLTVTQACAVHCRYCFRRHFAYQENNPGRQGWERVFEHIASDDSIHEVILSGGDPLSLSDEYLEFFFKGLSSIQQVKIIRLHTRFPAILPSRISRRFLEIVSASHKPVVIVLHINHPAEIDDVFKQAMFSLKNTGVHLLNQSVLLRDVNDSDEVLYQLSLKLFESHILPYYLHLLDPVEGAHHFSVSRENALAIYHALHAYCPGYLLPRLVEERPGTPGKMSVLS